MLDIMSRFDIARKKFWGEVHFKYIAVVRVSFDYYIDCNSIYVFFRQVYQRKGRVRL
jgi:hypothetical protein